MPDKRTWSSVPQRSFARARDLRKRPSKAEAKLWYHLGRNRLGVKFRRQHVIGPYIVDFYSSEAILVIEVDGDSHAEPEQIEHDRRRTKYLEAKGLRVLRFQNTDVLNNLEAVLAAIQRLIG